MNNADQTEKNETTLLAEEDKYYQIIIVKPRPGKTEPKHIDVEIVTRNKREFTDKKYLIKIKKEANEFQTIGAYLPTYGLVFPERFLKKIFSTQGDNRDNIPINDIKEVNDFYTTTRSLYITRKISQLLAKSWYAYLEAIKDEEKKIWNNFVSGNWKPIDLDILDGLIIREILLFDNQYSPDNYKWQKDSGYSDYRRNSKTLILPNSKAWQGICLSLLLGGQVYYGMGKDDQSIYEYQEQIGQEQLTQEQIKQQEEKAETESLQYYRRVSEPILSTFEMVNRYTMEVDWNRFKGDIQELQINPNQTNSLYKAIIPYPPIPSERNLSIEDIKKWAYAKDDQEDNPNDDSILPFYDKKTKSGEEIYELNVKYVSPPFPYLPLSTS